MAFDPARGRVYALALALSLLVVGAASAAAQEVPPPSPPPAPGAPEPGAPPGDADEIDTPIPPGRPPLSEQAVPGRRLRSWELPAIQVAGEPPPELREEERVGSYRQPRWTTVRRFPTTRVYVIPEGKIDVEYWMRIDRPRKQGPDRFRSFYEFEIGLPNRFQFDFYAIADHTSSVEPFDINTRMYELRYAFADWGEIPGNPTAYVEWVANEDAPDKWETKLLFGDEAAPGWHWGSNLVFEQEVSGTREREVQVTGALSKTIIDSVFSVGGEFKAANISSTEPGDDAQEFFLGPSVQWRPSERSHVDFTPLVGLGGESGSMQVWFILGFEF